MITIHKINNILNKDFSYNFKTKNIVNNVNSIYSNTELDKNSLVISMIYLYRYNKVKQIDIRNLYDILYSCIILSNKFLMDVNLQSCGKFENEILNALNWNLFVTEDEYFNFLQLIT